MERMVYIRHFRKDTPMHILEGRLWLILEGSAESEKNVRLGAGDLVLFASGRPMDIVVAANSIIIDCNLADSSLSFSDQSQRIYVIDDANVLSATLINLLKAQEEGESMLRVKGLYYQLLADVQDQLDTPASKLAAEGDDKAVVILQYILENYRHSLSLKEIAAHFHFSESYFSRWFHRNFQVSFRDYLQKLRLQEATQLLITTDMSITDVAMHSGFASYGAMAKAFKATYGRLPGSLRKQQSQPDEVDNIEILQLQDVDQIIGPLTAQSRLYHSKQQRMLTLDVSEQMSFIPNWNQVLQAGTAAECLRSSVQAQIRSLKETFKFTHIRISDLLVSELIPNKLRNDTFDYTYFFQLIKFFDELDLIPIFDVAIKPDSSGRDIVVHEHPYDGYTPIWNKHFQAFLDACLAQYSQEKISRWMFEFWLPKYWEQDVSEDELVQYAHLVCNAKKALRARGLLSPVGGPGMLLTGSWQSELSRCLELLSRNETGMDFMTFGFCNPLRSTTGTMSREAVVENSHHTLRQILPRSDEYYMRTLDSLTKVLKSKLNKLPTWYLMQTLPEPVSCYSLNDGAYTAAFLGSTILSFFDQCDGVFMPRYKNSDVDYIDQYALTCGGTGLLLRNGLKSPTYYLYTFLQKLGGTLIARGKHYMLTKQGDGYVMMVLNCKLHSDFYYECFQNEVLCSYTEPKLYEDNAPLELSISMKGLLPDTQYTIREHLISDSYGCLASELKKLGILDKPPQDVIEYLEHVTRPYQYFFTKHCQETLSFSVSLQPNDVLLLQIYPEN